MATPEIYIPRELLEQVKKELRRKRDKLMINRKVENEERVKEQIIEEEMKISAQIYCIDYYLSRDVQPKSGSWQDREPLGGNLLD